MSVVFVDWLTTTYQFDRMGTTTGMGALTSDVERFCATHELPLPTKSCIPHNGYTQAWELPDTGIVQFNGSRPDMGVNVTLPGKALSALGWKSILRTAVGAGHVSRIDVSIDVLDPSFDLVSLYRLVDAGEAKTLARSVSFVQSKTGCTLYVGKRSSDRMLRIYDKGGESGGETGRLYRIEAEVKGRAAHSVAKRVLEDADRGMALFRNILDCPKHAGYCRAIQSECVDGGFETEKKRKDTDTWLFGVVAEVMAVREELNPGTLDAFNLTVKALMGF